MEGKAGTWNGQIPTVGGLYSICNASANIWSVGEGGLIVKYTSQTGWVKQTAVTDLPLKKSILHG